MNGKKGWRGKAPPRCLHAKGKLKLILEEKLVTVVLCWGLGVESVIISACFYNK